VATVFDMDVRKLRVLCELDARGTIAEVASALHLTPSGVSQQIAALGREVGVQLVEPVGRRVRLTGAAKVLVQYGQEILAQVERTYAGLSAYLGGTGGTVRVAGHNGTLASIGLPAVARLKEVRPELTVCLREEEPAEATAMLLRGDVDLVIGVAANFDAAMDDARISAASLVVDHYDLVLPACHRLAYAPDVELSELASDTWVFTSIGPCREIGLFACRAAGFAPTVTQVMGDWASTLAAVRLGLGVALMPRLMLKELPPTVVTRRPAGEPLRYHVITMVRRGAEESPDLALVLDILDEVTRVRELAQVA
jgi:DNA-binding transcriptional LysR family regulator